MSDSHLPTDLRERAHAYAWQRPRSTQERVGVYLLAHYLADGRWPCASAEAVRDAAHACLREHGDGLLAEYRRGISGLADELFLWLADEAVYPAGYPYQQDMADTSTQETL